MSKSSTFSGLGPNDIKNTEAHNALYPDYGKNVELLNGNVKNWLGSHIEVNGKEVKTGVKEKFEKCLRTPTYTLFSNTTSAAQWNAVTGDSIVPLESPPQRYSSFRRRLGHPNNPDFSPITGANGDMGENDTAGLDPIFYFHHCFIDRVFWKWQEIHGCTAQLDIDAGYPGTNSVDNQGPTLGVAANSWLGLDAVWGVPLVLLLFSSSLLALLWSAHRTRRSVLCLWVWQEVARF